MAESTNIIMYLIDTNIYLTFHSIGVILSRHEDHETLLHFTQDVIVDSAVTLVTLEAIDMPRLVEIMTRFRLDFDDAYQYVAAEKYGAELISFDEDFDRTELGRKTPVKVLSTKSSVLMA